MILIELLTKAIVDLRQRLCPHRIFIRQFILVKLPDGRQEKHTIWRRCLSCGREWGQHDPMVQSTEALR